MHIAYLITWIVKNHYESDFFTRLPGGKEGIEALRNEAVTGSAFTEKYCDGCISGEFLSDEIFPFVRKFYKGYFKNCYVPYVIKTLNDLPLELEWNWEDYRSFEHILDRRYKKFLSSERSSL